MRSTAAGEPPSRQAIDARVLAWMREVAAEKADGEAWRGDEGRFDELARAIHAHQYAHCAAYGAYCDARSRAPHQVTSWREIPAVPTAAFKELALRCFDAEATAKVFRTSGTSQSDRDRDRGRGRGELHLDTLTLYEASLLPTIRRHLFPDLGPGDRMPMLVLAPSPERAPDSSLSHMFGVTLEAVGSEDSAFYQQEEGERESLAKALEVAAAGKRVVALCGTAFAFVHLLDAMEQSGKRLALSAGSRIMETGGFKGRSREVTREALYAGLEDRLGIHESHMVNQYGMTELGSQFYDSVLLEPHTARRKLGPPWARVRIVDPEDGREVRAGEAGMIVVHDLANTGNIAAIQTADLGRRNDSGEGFEVLGRAPGVEARGCSIAADLALSQATSESP